MKRAALSACALIPVALSAGAEALRPAPDYFVEAMTSITTAENIATACPKLTFDTLSASETSDKVLAQLEGDGFNSGNLSASMADPGDAVRAAQAAFRQKHGLGKDGNTFEAICAAGFAEIAEGSRVGAYLVEITGEGAVDPTKADSSD